MEKVVEKVVEKVAEKVVEKITENAIGQHTKNDKCVAYSC